MGVFDSDIQTAKDLIDENGEDAVIRRTVPGARPIPDPEPWKPVAPSISEVPVRAVFLNYNIQGAGEPYVDGSLIKTGDKKVLVAAADIQDITASDIIIRANGDKYKIVIPKLLDPNGQKILWTLQARQ